MPSIEYFWRTKKSFVSKAINLKFLENLVSQIKQYVMYTKQLVNIFFLQYKQMYYTTLITIKLDKV